MAELRPFRGVRPPKDSVLQIAAPPYDVVNAEEARAYAKGNTRSFFRVSRPEIDLPAGTDEHADEVYDKGRENLALFQREGWLRQDGEPSFYLYRQRMGAHVQTGVVAAASVEEYDAGRIKKHELTRADKEDDRTRHVDVLGGNDEPVFLTYRASPAISALVEEGTRGAPEYDFTTEDGIGHTFWVVRGELNARLEEAFRAVPALYIADGHHRSAAASRVHALRRQRGESGGHARFLAVVFPHDQMQILDYNRVVKDLNGLSSEELLRRLGERFEVKKGAQKKPSQAHHFGMYLGGAWYQLTAKPGTFEPTPTGVLDVTILQRNVLEPLLGIGDPRKDARIHFVGGIRGMEELERLVDGGAYKVAFSMFPTSLDQLMAISDAGEIMPPKSTWFEPKLRSGLVLHLF
ncbi:DUF1015 domain-containing protein [Hyalangium rubrum]|uniref:DUF1015 family protein n=1 Tax=Hyalangium rubrum TaxID=3103134 RepID=A0ABU5H8V6_9BACT|nr:DUF1015 family protein [Hyalangium sp. s54d21]MDY7229740.1 DUF1015 family protein [Hyalangium sp. s54d21]